MSPAMPTMRELVAPLREHQNEAERAYYEALAIAHDAREALGDELAGALLGALCHLAPWTRDTKREAELEAEHAAEVQRLSNEIELLRNTKNGLKDALCASERCELRWAARVKLLEARLARITATAEGRDEERAS